MDFRVFSSGKDIPIVYKRNSTIAIQIDRVFNIKNYFDSVVLIKNTKHIHITDQSDDLFSMFVMHLLKSNQYDSLFVKKNIYFFYKGEIPTYEFV
jgi:predicted ribosome quality control (RQC) complex YloA/Tae2 family protein